MSGETGLGRHVVQTGWQALNETDIPDAPPRRQWQEGTPAAPSPPSETMPAAVAAVAAAVAAVIAELLVTIAAVLLAAAPWAAAWPASGPPADGAAHPVAALVPRPARLGPPPGRPPAAARLAHRQRGWQQCVWADARVAGPAQQLRPQAPAHAACSQLAPHHCWRAPLAMAAGPSAEAEARLRRQLASSLVEEQRRKAALSLQLQETGSPPPWAWRGRPWPPDWGPAGIRAVASSCVAAGTVGATEI